MPSRAEILFGILYFERERRVTVEELERGATRLGVAANIEVDRNFGIGVACPSTLVKGDDLWVAVTGEIENASDIAVEDDTASPKPTQAEIVAASWRGRGAAAAAALYGNFNAVVWDRERRRLTLLADRCGGVKTLYYYRGRDFLVFGSTLKTVLAQGDKVPRTLDTTSLADLLVLRHPISPRTMIAGVSVLDAGARVDIADGVVEAGRYWHRSPWRDTGADLETLERDYFAALERAVALASGGGEVCMMLSGGVDSAALVALLRRAGVPRIRTFSVHIGADEASDRIGSQTIARMFHTEHRSLDGLDAGCLDSLPEMIWSFEAPAVDFHPTYFLARALRDECDLVVGGYGNDLIWGVSTPRAVTSSTARRLFPPLNEIHYLAGRRRLGRTALRRLYKRAERTDLDLFRRLTPYRADTGHGHSDAIALDEALFGDQLVFRELGKVLVDANGLWPRLPYTHASVVACAETVPPAARVRRRGGHSELKWFFKRVMEKQKVLPPEIIHRPKTWMYSPTAQWLRGELGKVVGKLLRSPRLRQRDLFSAERIDQLLVEHESGRRDHAYTLMMLVAIEIWLRLFVDASSLTTPKATLEDLAGGDGA